MFCTALHLELKGQPINHQGIAGASPKAGGATRFSERPQKGQSFAAAAAAGDAIDAASGVCTAAAAARMSEKRRGARLRPFKQQGSNESVLLTVRYRPQIPRDHRTATAEKEGDRGPKETIKRERKREFFLNKAK